MADSLRSRISYGGAVELRLSSEPLSHHRLALCPQRLGVFPVEGVAAHAAAELGVVDNLGDVAILAELCSDLAGRGDHRGPHRGRGALWDSLPAERLRARRLAGADIVHQALDDLGCHVAAEFGLDAARVHRRRPHALALVPAVELDGEEDIGG